jgi:hypothetical protein
MKTSLVCATLLVAFLAGANAQDNPLPQCDPVALLEAKNVLFLGNASSIQVGKFINYIEYCVEGAVIVANTMMTFHQMRKVKQ